MHFSPNTSTKIDATPLTTSRDQASSNLRMKITVAEVVYLNLSILLPTGSLEFQITYSTELELDNKRAPNVTNDLNWN
jgi:hypothetical protein